jgi:hypothetical protein
MGWTGKSWIFSNLLGESTTRVLASSLFVLAAIAFVISGFGIFFRAAWWWPMLVGSALLSSVILLFFWDGGMQLIVQKGLIGFLISIAILFILLILKRPSIAF